MAAIYQWIENGIVYQVLTTTPYPIEAIEYAQISFDLGPDCSMTSIPGDSGDHSFSFNDAEMTAVRLDLPQVSDSGDHSFSLNDAEMTAIRLDLPEVADSGDHSFSLNDADMKRRRIDALVPDEGLDISFTLDTSNCSMTDA